MKWLESARDMLTGALVGAEMGADTLVRTVEAAEEATVKESGELADLTLAIEDVGWRDLTAPGGNWNFNRQTLRRLVALSRVLYLINPLIRRAVTVQELYVWGSGCEIKDINEDVNEVLTDFFQDPKNQRVIGASWAERERDQRIDGNVFFVFFFNKATGAVRVRLLPFDQIEDIMYNPEDIKEPWYYIRSSYAVSSLDAILSEPVVDVPREVFPDYQYNPKVKPPRTANGTPIRWDTCVLHVRTGGLTQMRFGLPELYSALNWASAYKRILENFATILAAYARIAMKITGLPGAKGVAAAKSKLNTGITTSRFLDNNPTPNTAATMPISGNVDIAAVKTANSTTGPDEARALRSMVAAGTDTPEHFFGDSDVGNFATSTTLDRPTELKMVARQKMWMDVILTMCGIVTVSSAKASQGKLRTAGFKIKAVTDLFDGTVINTIVTPAGKTNFTTVTFPSILQRDVTDRVRAVVQAATLGGNKAEGIIPSRKFLFKLLMVALGEANAEMLMNQYYPEDVEQGFIDPADVAKDNHLIALGKKELGDAAVDQADVAQQNADKPTPKLAPAIGPKPSGSPLPAVTNR